LAALVGTVIWAYNEFETFRATLQGTWETTKQVFSNLWDTVMSYPKIIINAFEQVPMAIVDTFKGVGNLFSAIFKGEFGKIPGILGNIADNVGDATPVIGVAKDIGQSMIKGVGDSFNKGWESVTEEAAKKFKKNMAKKMPHDLSFLNLGGSEGDSGQSFMDSVTPSSIGKGGNGSGGEGIENDSLSSDISSSSGGDKVRNISVTIQQITGIENLNTTYMQESVNDLKEQITEAIVESIRDSEVAISNR